MKKLKVVVSLPNSSAFQLAQAEAARSAAVRMGLDLQVMHANDDCATQGQQMLRIMQSSSDLWPSAFIVEPASGTGLRSVAEMAVAKGIAWVFSNSDVDYFQRLRKSTQVPVFMVTQGQHEIGQLQGKQLAALLPNGGSVLYIEGPATSAVAEHRREGMSNTRPRNVFLTKIRSNWSEESAFQSTVDSLRLASALAPKFDLVAGQNHELALGAKRAFQNIGDIEQRKKMLGLPFIGIGISSHLKPLVQDRSLAAAVVTSLTMELALKLLVRAIESKVQPPERSVSESYSYPELDKLAPKL